MLTLEDCWGKRTLILGEVNSGKTQMALDLLDQILAQSKDEIAILDLAPERTRGIGGKMDTPSDSRILYHTTKITPPRLTAKDLAEMETYALQNARAIEELFSLYLKNPKNTLVINDVSLYLQRGDPVRLQHVLQTSQTVIINGYYGKSFADSALSKREREQMDRLAEICDRIIHL